MQGLQFSDTTNKNGLIQECEFLLNLGDATISGDASSAALLKVFTRLLNQNLQKIITMIFSSQDEWEWDDNSNALYPIATRSLVANQADYTFLTPLWTLGTEEGGTANPTVTIAVPGVFTLTGHGLAVGDAIRLTTTGALPTGLTAGTTYYVVAGGFVANTFEVSATQGGTAITTTGTQSGTHSLTRNLNPLRIKRVELSYDGGSTWRRANPFNINESLSQTDATTINNNFTSTNPFYDVEFNTLRLYPIPTASSTAGLKIWFYRSALEFISTDTFKQPPLDPAWHKMLAIGACLDYSIARDQVKKIPTFEQMYADFERRLREYYGSKQEDRRLVMGSIYSSGDYGA